MNENKLTTLQHIKKCLDSIRALIGQVLSATTDALEELEQKITPDTWKKNTVNSEGYVDKGEGQINKVWGTDAEGNPGWKEPNEIDTIIASNVLFNDGSNAEENLNGLKKSVSDGKELVAGAITEKGVETAADATFQEMADNIGEIETSGGEPRLQEKTANLSTALQVIKPDNGYDGLSQVTVVGVVGSAAASDVFVEKTFNSTIAGINASGTMPNKGSTTQDAAYSEDSSYMYLTIPYAGYYNTASKLRTPKSNIGDQCKSGFISISPSSSYTINCGFKPKKFVVMACKTLSEAETSNRICGLIYDEDIDANFVIRFARYSSSGMAMQSNKYPFDAGNFAWGLASINSDGFTFKTSKSTEVSVGTARWFALG